MGIRLAPAFFWIPGVAPIMTGALLGSALMGRLEGGAIGALTAGARDLLKGADEVNVYPPA